MALGALAPIFEHAAEHGSDWAVVHPGGTATWGEAADDVARTANAFSSLDIPRRSRIAIVGDNSYATLVAYAGALLAGHGAILVNQQLTAPEISHMLADGEAGAVWTDEAHLRVVDTAAESAGEVVVVADGATSEWASAVAAASSTPPSLDRPIEADLGYTSGTTGRAKGVAVPREAAPTVQARVELATRHHSVGLGPHLVAGPLYHGGPHAAVGLLLCGTPVVLIGRFDAERALEAIERHRIATSVMVSTNFSRLLQLPDERRATADVSSLRLVIQTGSPCPHPVKRAMIDWWGPIIRETYGGIESGPVAGISSEEWLAHPGSVGQAIAPFTFRVVREDGSTCDVGEDGVIYFEDPTGLGVEYRNAPEKSAAAHLEPGVFTLGDFGHVDAEGYLYLTTRRDDLVLSGGVNVYPAEAESTLVEHPAVAEAACFGVADDDLGERLVGVIVTTDPTLTSAEVLEFCRERLARHKVPRELRVVESIPTSAMGKVDRRTLRTTYGSEA